MNKAIAISGTSSGIGLGLAKQLCKTGYEVYGISRSKSSINDKNYFHFQGDISLGQDVIQFFREIRQKEINLYGLINNAAVASMNHLVTLPEKTITNILDINVKGTMLMMREAAKLMIKNKSGRIINTTSVAAPMALEGESVYAASKAAIENLTKTIAKELAPFNISVNAIGYPPVKTDLIKGVPEEKINKILQQQTIKKMTEINDITNAIEFLLKPESKMVTGQIIYLGGTN